MTQKKKVTAKMQREGQMLHDPYALTLRDLSVLERQLAGMTKKQITSELNLTTNQWDQITQKERYKAKIEELRQERLRNIEQIMSDEAFIRSHAREAAIRDIHLMRNAKHEGTQQKSIFDILDRAGIGTHKEGGRENKINVGVQIILSNEVSKGDPDLIRVLTRLTENNDEPI